MESSWIRVGNYPLMSNSTMQKHSSTMSVWIAMMFNVNSKSLVISAMSSNC